MDLEKSINVAWAGLQRARLKRQDSSSHQLGFIAPPDSVDETTDDSSNTQESSCPDLDPHEALTPSSQKEFLEWLVINRNKTENYTKEDLRGVFGDAIEQNTEFLTTSFISYDQSRNASQWNEFKEAGIFKKVIQFPKQCVYELAKSCLSNAQHFSVKFLLTRYPLSKELHMLMLLYIYNIILQPRIFSVVLPIILTLSSFGVMIVYSYRIIVANFDLFFSWKNIFPLITVSEELDPFVNNYFRSKSSNSYVVFFSACVVYILSMPISKAGSSIITAVCLLFLILSSLIILLGRRNSLSSFLALLYIISNNLPLQVLPPAAQLAPVILFSLIVASFVWVIYRYRGHGLGLMIWPPVFFLMWGQALLVARLHTSLDIAFVRGFISVLLFIFVFFLLRNYIVHIIIPSILGLIFLYRENALIGLMVFIVLFLLSILVSRYLSKHWIYSWFLSWDPFEITFGRFIWAGFVLLLLVSVFKGQLHTSRKLPPLAWEDYKEWCTPPQGWNQANEAKYQLKCLHLAGRNVSVTGKVLSVSLASRENAMEYYFNKLQMVNLGDGLKCLFGQDRLTKEECDRWAGTDEENICIYTKCAINLGTKYTFKIMIDPLNGVASKMKIEASNYFQEEISEFEIGQTISVHAEIMNPGSRDINLKLKCIRKLGQPCASQPGLTPDSLIQYIRNLILINFNLIIF